MARAWGAVAAAVVLSACGGFGRSTPDWKPSDALERSARMLRQLDRLEADLHDAHADGAVYTELVARHGQAQQIACQVTQEHVQEIERLDLAQQKKRAEKLRKRRLAMVTRKTPLARN